MTCFENTEPVDKLLLSLKSITNENNLDNFC